MKKNIFFFFIITLSFLATACQNSLFRKQDNIVERAERQKLKADMVIAYTREKRIFVERPLMNVKNNIHHPFTKELLDAMLDIKQYIDIE